MKLVILVAVFSILVYHSDGKEASVYDFKVPDIKGQSVDLGAYKGQVTLIVNVASQCGHTDSHYKALKRLQDILGFKDKFSVLAFPSNDFGEQEPWEEKEIEEFVRGHFKADFPLFSKVKVIGDEADPLWKFIVSSSGVSPQWNFQKYLISKEGKVLKSWDATVSVESIFTYVQNVIDGNLAGAEKSFASTSGEKSTTGNSRGESVDESENAKEEL